MVSSGFGGKEYGGIFAGDVKQAGEREEVSMGTFATLYYKQGNRIPEEKSRRNGRNFG